MSGRCWTPPRCSRAGAPATTCCGWLTPRGWAPSGSTRWWSRPGWAPRSGARAEDSPSACGSGRRDAAPLPGIPPAPALADRGTRVMVGLAGEKTVALRGEGGLRFSEVSPHRGTLEEAYMELTRDAVEFRATAAAGEAAR